MTLLHAFVRDELAKLKRLVIPEKHVPVEFEEIGKLWNTTVQVPAETWNIVIAEAERRFDEVQPDVYYELDTQAKIALEVRYTHAVDGTKLDKLRRVVSMCVEFDVSDLPAAGIGSADLKGLLSDPAALIQRHQGCDWGEVDAHDTAVNNHAVLHGGRIVGCHKVDGIDVWLITEAIGGERGNPIIGTTMLLASEY